ncbi:hypothetical protein BDV96DRAFT_141554 [Lophiotrema nucula]|uniref:Uncharacterized protein n=1 Tax=Lophiotrema nucula TaxID=690887 RepID=A0A6A5ZT96_9PLEO|nr:hypothetical protein BDV96DRAFT_141554 [Lophiotrema nucula]
MLVGEGARGDDDVLTSLNDWRLLPLFVGIRFCNDARACFAQAEAARCPEQHRNGMCITLPRPQALECRSSGRGKVRALSFVLAPLVHGRRSSKSDRPDATPRLCRTRRAFFRPEIEPSVRLAPLSPPQTFPSRSPAYDARRCSCPSS